MHSAGLALPELDALRANPVATQCSGQGTSPPAKRSSAWRYKALSSWRVTSLDCDDAQAPSWEARGRLAKYSSDSDRGTRSALPSTRTCRYNGYQPKSSATYEDSAISAALRDL